MKFYSSSVPGSTVREHNKTNRTIMHEKNKEKGEKKKKNTGFLNNVMQEKGQKGKAPRRTAYIHTCCEEELTDDN